MGLDITLISAVLSSGVIAALLTATFSKLTADKKVRIDNITGERKQWRDRLRNLVQEVNQKAYGGNWNGVRILRSELTVRLNPVDEEDSGILACLDQIVKQESVGDLNEFSDRMALLLKHDWERVKVEAGGIGPLHSFALACILSTMIGIALWTWYETVYLTVGLRQSSILWCGALLLAVCLLAASYVSAIGALIAGRKQASKQPHIPLILRLAMWIAGLNHNAVRVPYKKSRQTRQQGPTSP